MIQRRKFATRMVLLAVLMSVPCAQAAPRKPHMVALGAARKVPYSHTGDPAGAAAGETELRLRAFTVDGVLKEWTTGPPHDVTDRSFVVRRALHINDTLPGETHAAPANKTAESKSHWVWQRGPWLLIDRVTGHALPLKLPDYDPGISQPVWFRDYAAYCGLTANGKSLYAVVAQIAARKPTLVKKLAPWDVDHPAVPACAPAEWQREPLRITFHPTGQDAISYDVVPGSTLLVEESADESETPAAPAKP